MHAACSAPMGAGEGRRYEEAEWWAPLARAWIRQAHMGVKLTLHARIKSQRGMDTKKQARSTRACQTAPRSRHAGVRRVCGATRRVGAEAARGDVETSGGHRQVAQRHRTLMHRAIDHNVQLCTYMFFKANHTSPKSFIFDNAKIGPLRRHR
jgi:hypothetical protein